MSNGASKLRAAIKLIPGTETLYHRFTGRHLPGKTEDVFRDILAEKRWGVNESESGGGSDLSQTQVIRDQLPTVWLRRGVTTLLDLPCGDFYWMQHVSLDGVEYFGADVLPELIEKNVSLHARPGVTFEKLNLLTDPLPKVDMILSRDCLVHFSYRDVWAALQNICDSQSTYLLTTTFMNRRRNHDIATGQFRPLNLQARPFALPEPLELLNEGCTEFNGEYQDKSLGLWRVSDVRRWLESRKHR